MNRHFWQRCATWGMTIVLCVMSGCSLFPESMQPQNLQKWNRGPGPSNDPFLSIPDPMPNDRQQAEEPADSDVDPSTNQAG